MLDKPDIVDVKSDYLIEFKYSPTSWIYTQLLKDAFKNNTTVYTYQRSGTIRDISIDDVIKVVQLHTGKCVTTCINNPEQRSLYYSDNTMIEITTEKKDKNEYIATIKIASSKSDTVNELIKWSRKHLIVSHSSTVYAVGQGHSGPTLQELGKIQDELVAENYDVTIMQKTEYIVKQLNSNTPQGRLTIINGEPGTGKTHLIKGIIPKIKNAIIILLPTRLIGDIDGPALVSLLAEWKSDYGYLSNVENPAIVLILEDADKCLVTRNETNMSVVSSMLNHTDGIFGSMLDIRIIATTNAHQLQFDKAFTRPGRLCAHITINKLTPEHATEVYTRITEGKKKKYKEQVTLAQVYADANDNPYAYKEEEKKVGFVTNET